MARFEDILYFVDCETSASDPMESAVLRARTLGSRLTFASVIPPYKMPLLGGRFGPKELEQLAIEEEVERLDAMVNPLRGGDVRIATRVLVGDPAGTIVRAVVADGYQMVCKAPTDGGGLRDRSGTRSWSGRLADRSGRQVGGPRKRGRRGWGRHD